MVRAQCPWVVDEFQTMISWSATIGNRLGVDGPKSSLRFLLRSPEKRSWTWDAESAIKRLSYPNGELMSSASTPIQNSSMRQSLGGVPNAEFREANLRGKCPIWESTSKRHLEQLYRGVLFQIFRRF